METKTSVVGIYGYSDTGKTSLLESIISDLNDLGYNITSIKHTDKPYSLDSEGTDTWRHGEAGAVLTVFSSESETTYIHRKDTSLQNVIKTIESLSDCDLILVEGYKEAEIPKIAVGEVAVDDYTAIVYEDNYREIIDFFQKEIEVKRIQNQLPGLDCKKCGYSSCRELAQQVYQGKAVLGDCVTLNVTGIELTVNGEEVPLGNFPSQLIKHTIRGMMRSLKGVEDISQVDLKIDYRLS